MARARASADKKSEKKSQPVKRANQEHQYPKRGSNVFARGASSIKKFVSSYFTRSKNKSQPQHATREFVRLMVIADGQLQDTQVLVPRPPGTPTRPSPKGLKDAVMGEPCDDHDLLVVNGVRDCALLKQTRSRKKSQSKSRGKSTSKTRAKSSGRKSKSKSRSKSKRKSKSKSQRKSRSKSQRRSKSKSQRKSKSRSKSRSQRKTSHQSRRKSKSRSGSIKTSQQTNQSRLNQLRGGSPSASGTTSGRNVPVSIGSRRHQSRRRSRSHHFEEVRHRQYDGRGITISPVTQVRNVQGGTSPRSTMTSSATTTMAPPLDVHVRLSVSPSPSRKPARTGRRRKSGSRRPKAQPRHRSRSPLGRRSRTPPPIATRTRSRSNAQRRIQSPRKSSRAQ